MLRSLLILLALYVTGCGSFTYVSLVQRDPEGGTLAVGRDRHSRKEAERRMAEHCDGAYVVTNEERIVVGQKTAPVDDEGTVRTKNIYERQVSYRCLQR